MAKNIIFRTQRKLKRFYYRIFDLHPPSKPLISGDTFKLLAHHVIDSSKSKIIVSNIKDYDIIFVKTDYLSLFSEKIPKNFNKKYILITHNSDLGMDYYNQFINVLKPFKWWAQNFDSINDNIKPLPIGLENLRLYTNGVKKYFHNKAVNKNSKSRIFYKFSVNTNPKARNLALNFIQNLTFSETTNVRLYGLDYVKHLSEYRFCIAPPGNGLDTHRVWECIYLGVIPICLKSPMIDYFITLKLPIWGIDRWEDLNYYDSEVKLLNMYQDIMSTSTLSASYCEYWKDVIVYKENL